MSRVSRVAIVVQRGHSIANAFFQVFLQTTKTINQQFKIIQSVKEYLIEFHQIYHYYFCVAFGYMLKGLIQKNSDIYMINTEDKPQQILNLYEQLCKFNYFRDLDPHRSFKANPELDDLAFGAANHHAPTRFSNSDSYIQFWSPLFMQEVKGYIVSSSTTETTTPEQFQLLSYYQLGVFKVMEFRRLQQSKISYISGSLMLLSPQKTLPEDDNYPHLIGVVYKSESNLYVRVIFANGGEAQTHTNDLILTSKIWYLQCLCSLTTVEREYKALYRFPNLQPCLREVLLNPQEHRFNTCKKFSIPNNLDEKLKSSFNESQYQALSASLKHEGITLVQGPPGTGKTKTVLGILSVLLQSSINRQQDQQVPLLLRWKTSEKQLINNVDLNPWIKPDYIDWRDQPFVLSQKQPLSLTKIYPKATRQIPLFSHIEQVSTPVRVLVCGPSNASVDEVIRKLIAQKLLDGSGKPYLPSFVRIGENYHESLQPYSVDAQVLKLKKIEQADPLNAKKKILRQSRIVFATLSAAASGVLENSQLQFDTVIIDEAGQAVEVSTLIPLLYGCRRLILIGDPKQLPATVFSSVCLQHHYDQSLFERLFRAEYPVNLLKVQYRMHPDISYIVGKNFYSGQLQNGQKILSQPKGIPSPFFMLHIEGSSEIFAEQSYYNPVEAQCVKILVSWLSKNHKDIGVLSPYSAQVKWLNNQRLGANCQIKTIDSFQGREKQVIIFSAVRAQLTGNEKRENKKRTIGFVGDGRRVNVALSRAREVCVIVGDLERLALSKVWKNIIQDCRNRGNAFKVICAQQLRQAAEGMNKLRIF